MEMTTDSHPKERDAYKGVLTIDLDIAKDVYACKHGLINSADNPP